MGEIPEAIFNISSLEVIDFSFNKLSGRIPSTTGLHLPNLEELYLGENQLEGEIPLFITNASKLQILSLSQNFLTGTIPTNLGNLRELRHMFLHHNQLTNEPTERELRFFNSLADCRMLRYLQVGNNPLSGYRQLERLTSLGIQDNNLAGNIPSEFGKLKQLQGLQGHIPEGVCHLSNLVKLYLDGNELSGLIPECLGKSKHATISLFGF
uniref:Uncharacterized protein n=1 Tax=Solanum lycopersicum TaxID=4081 RepID=A0A3Q7G1B4_SOLLC